VFGITLDEAVSCLATETSPEASVRPLQKRPAQGARRDPAGGVIKDIRRPLRTYITDGAVNARCLKRRARIDHARRRLGIIVREAAKGPSKHARKSDVAMRTLRFVFRDDTNRIAKEAA